MYYIREIQEGDFRKDNGLLETLKNLTKVYDLSSEDLIKIWEEIKRENSQIFVAISSQGCQRGQVVGFIKVLYDKKFFRGGALVAHIEDVVVRKEHEKQGIGRSLVKTALVAAKKRRCYKAILDCQPEFKGFYKLCEISGKRFKQSDITLRLDF